MATMICAPVSRRYKATNVLRAYRISAGGDDPLRAHGRVRAELVPARVSGLPGDLRGRRSRERAGPATRTGAGRTHLEVSARRGEFGALHGAACTCVARWAAGRAARTLAGPTSLRTNVGADVNHTRPFNVIWYDPSVPTDALIWASAACAKRTAPSSGNAQRDTIVLG